MQYPIDTIINQSAGTTTPFYFGESITSDLVNYNGYYTYGSAPKGQYRKQTTDVGSFPPNAFGLYDMHGNVWEWCLDDYIDNYYGTPKDGRALTRQSKRKLLRGGSWKYHSENCRSADRNNSSIGYNGIGFRIACASAMKT